MDFFSKKTRSIALIGILVVMLIVAGCSSDKSNGNDNDNGAQEQEPLEVVFVTNSGERAALMVNVLLPFLDKVEEETEGRVTFDRYPNASLVNAGDEFDALMSGIAGLAFQQTSYTNEHFVLASVMELPFSTAPDAVGNTDVLYTLIEEFPELNEEFEVFKLLGVFSTLPVELHTNTPVRTMKDMSGLSIACTPNNGLVAALEAAGATAVVMPTGDFYLSIERGIVDGCAIPWGAFRAQSLHEVTTYHTNAGLVSQPMWFAFSWDVWNTISPDDQNTILELAEGIGYDIARAVEDNAELGRQEVIEMGQEIITLSAEEREKWAQAAGSMAEEWVTKVEAEGLPGQAIYDRAQELLAEKYK